MRKLFAVLVTLALMAPTLPAAASSQLQVTVRPGYDGMVRPGSWAPVDVSLANAGPNVSGNVEISVLSRPISQSGFGGGQSIDYSVPVTIPQHSSKRFSTAVYVPTLFDRLQVRLVSGGHTLVQQTVALQRVDPAQVFCGVLSNDPSAFDALNGLTLADGQRQPHVVDLDLLDLPTNPQLLSGLDCLIVSDDATRGLSALQQSALTAWVNDGGILTIGTGPTGAGALDGLPPALLPAKLDGTAPVHSLESLAGYLGVPSESGGPWLVGNLKVTDGTVAVADENQPLVVVGRRGKGAVFMLAMSLTQKPLRGWSGLDRLWVYILSYTRLPDSSTLTYTGPDTTWGRAPRDVLIRGGGAASPETQRLLFGLVLFGLLIGPGNYLVLSRFGRRELALLTIPVMAVAATVGALVYAGHHRQGDVVVNQVSIARTWDGSGVGSLHSFVGVFALHPQHYQLTIPANALVSNAALTYGVRGQTSRTTPPAQVLQSGQPQLQGIDLEPGNLSSFSLDGHLSESGKIGGPLLLNGHHLGGKVVNGFSSPIYSAALIAGSSVEFLGDLRPGASHAVSLDVGSDSPTGYRDMSQVVDHLYPGRSRVSTSSFDPRYDVLSSALNPYQSYAPHVDLSSLSLIGWLDQSVDSVSDPTSGEEAHKYTLFTTSLPLQLPGSTQVIPAQLVDRQALISTYSTRSDASGVTVNAGDSIAFQYTSPADPAHFTLRSLTLATASPTT
ncbi:MAG TPA: hypothetical protein VNL16_06190, partial [Chloroflexota bacterium]|nr:hypothetical protein [Chloroflexota bacterium]